MVRATHADDLLLEDLLRAIEQGTLALPNFQRDFDWTDQDVRALLGTVLSGWPIGSLLLIEVEATSREFYQPRPFESAPPLSENLELVTLDGQQRLTALFQSLTGSGRTRYALRLGDDFEVGNVDSLDSAIVSLSADVWNKKYTDPPSQWAERYIPLTALRSASGFFEWRDMAIPTGTQESRQLTEIYRDMVSGLHSYRIPGVIVNRSIPPQAVARIFERVNRHGRTLGAFDLVVARSFTGTFNLRKKWEDALEEYPDIRNFQRDDGLPVLSVLALRQQEDVRQSAVLNLKGGAIRDGWDDAVRNYAEAIAYLTSELGVSQPDWLPYKQMLTVLTAINYDLPLRDQESSVKNWFWATGFGQRYWAASNTRAVSDYRALRDGSWSQDRSLPLERDSLRESTRQQQGALHKTFLALLANRLAVQGSGNLGGGESHTQYYEYSLFPRDAGDWDPALHLRTFGFIVDASDREEDDWVAHEFVPRTWQAMDPISVIDGRANDVVEYLNIAFGVRAHIVNQASGASLIDEQ